MKRFLKNKVNLQYEGRDAPGVFVVEIYDDGGAYSWIDSIWSTMELAEAREREIIELGCDFYGGAISKYPLDTLTVYNDVGRN